MNEYGEYVVQRKADKETIDKAFAGLPEALSQGETLSAYARRCGVSYSVLYARLEKAGKETKEEFARARQAGFDKIADDCLAIADTKPERIDGKMDAAEIAWRKNQIYTRMQLLAKWNPKKYGDKVTLTGDEDAPIHHKIDVNFV